MLKSAILGAPASGKGTISSRIVKKFDIVHLSSGDLLRNQIKNRTKLGEKAEGYIKAGQLVPDNIMMDLVLRDLDKVKNKNWLLDGFPRTQEQAKVLFGKYPLTLAINLVVPFEVIIDRVKGRWIHVASGRVYNTTFNAPKIPGLDDVTNEPLEQRPDDKPQAVRNRLEVYSRTIEDVLKFYKDKKILKDFHGSTSDEIWPQVEQYLAQFLSPRQ